MVLYKGKWVEVPEGREGASEAEIKGMRVIRSWESTQTWTGKTTKVLNLSQNSAHSICFTFIVNSDECDWNNTKLSWAELNSLKAFLLLLILMYEFGPAHRGLSKKYVAFQINVQINV